MPEAHEDVLAFLGSHQRAHAEPRVAALSLELELGHVE